MPRKKKDGRFINYYIDRQIYEKLERYATYKGQQMTTAIERILEQYLNDHEGEMSKEGGFEMYCPNCNSLVQHEYCSVCGNHHLRQPDANDSCFLAEKDAIWSSALMDVLTQNGIPFITKNILGAGMSMKVGPLLERTRFYVPYAYYEQAKHIESSFFSSDALK